MKSTEKKATKVGDKFYAQGKIWSPESYARFKQYQNKFTHDHYKAFTMRLDKENDADILDRLKEQDNGTIYIKALIRDDMKKYPKNNNPAVIAFGKVAEAENKAAKRRGGRPTVKGKADKEEPVKSAKPKTAKPKAAKATKKTSK